MSFEKFLKHTSPFRPARAVVVRRGGSSSGGGGGSSGGGGGSSGATVFRARSASGGEGLEGVPTHAAADAYTGTGTGTGTDADENSHAQLTPVASAIGLDTLALTPGTFNLDRSF